MDETTNNNQTNAPASSEVNGENNEDSSLLAKDTIPENDTTANGIHNNDDIIEVTEEDENDAPPPRLEDDNDDDSAVEILDAVAFREQQQATAAAAASTALDEGEDSDEELRCVGTANETKLPHNRQDCLEFRYNNSNNDTNSTCCAETTLENAKFCQLCYCYVCDKPASECTDWYLGGKGFIYKDGNGGPPEDQKQSATDDEEEGAENTTLRQYKNHCNATDKGSSKNLWKNMRTAIKNGQDPSTVTGDAMASNPDDSLAQYMARYTVPAAAAMDAMLSGTAEHVRQRQRERHRHRAHATGRGGAYQRRTAAGDGGEGNYSSIYGSVSMDAANAMDFSSTTTTASRAPRQERRRRTRPAGSNNEQRSRHSSHRDRMRTQAILEDLYS